MNLGFDSIFYEKVYYYSEKRKGMNRQEIIQKIESIRKSVEQDQFEILTKKIMERKFHWHRSNRNFIVKKLIEGMRKQMIKEIDLILEPILDQQREINLRFLKEIKSIRDQIESKKVMPIEDEKKTK
ncbi:MAG: hypothetical protein ACOC5G_02520 [Acidobacteriota bacterium]